MKSTQEIWELERALLKLENLHASFDYLRIRLASPDKIQTWAKRILPSGEVVGEVKEPETINFRTHQPEFEGLFCEKIFGPIKNWKCRCGKYNGFAVDRICDVCDVEITEARVRRYRMGYIELNCPVTHLWYLKGIPSYLTILLRCYDPELSTKNLEHLVYFRDGGEDEIDLELAFFPFLKEVVDQKNNRFDRFFLKYRPKIPREESFYEPLHTSRYYERERRGAEILQAALDALNLPFEIQKARAMLDEFLIADFQKIKPVDKSIVRRIRILESFLATKTNPSWTVLTVLPVLPPNLRPLVELENGRLVAADINEIYRLVLIRNTRLAEFLYEYRAPEIITVNGRRLLQQSVDALIDNARLPKNRMICLNDKPLKGLTEILEGKQGRFRQSLLGKRVDYSGRSVIVVGPNLRLNECGLPYEMGVELFQPFLIHELLNSKIEPPSHNTKLAQIILKKNKPFVWVLLEKLTRKHCILLNRAPTLHRFGIQGFDPLIVLGQAIQLHPLVCTGFNADFDGDQMAVHVPLYESSQLEVRSMMRPSYNVLSPADGEVILKPTQDMVIGCYYMTLMISNQKFPLHYWFGSEDEALSAFYQKKVTIHTPILVRYSLLNFPIEIKNKTLTLLKHGFFFENTDVLLHRVFPSGKTKYYLITSIGIMIAYWIKEETYQLTDLFLETTPGRLVFSRNFKNIMQKNEEYDH